MRTYEKRSRFRNFVIGAVITGATFAGLHYGQEYMHDSIEKHLENSPRLNRAVEVLSYPRKKLQECIHGKDYQKEAEIERKVHEGETQ